MSIWLKWVGRDLWEAPAPRSLIERQVASCTNFCTQYTMHLKEEGNLLRSSAPAVQRNNPILSCTTAIATLLVFYCLPSSTTYTMSRKLDEVDESGVDRRYHPLRLFCCLKSSCFLSHFHLFTPSFDILCQILIRFWLIRVVIDPVPVNTWSTLTVIANLTLPLQLFPRYYPT